MRLKIYQVPTKRRGVQRFVVDDRFHTLEYRGQGGYGTVCSAIDQSLPCCAPGEECAACDGDEATGGMGDLCTRRQVAIKQVKVAHTTSSNNQRLLREIRLLRHYLGFANILQLREVLFIPFPDSFQEVYIVTEWMETDFGRIINSKQNLFEQQVQIIMYQVLLGLATIHRSNVIHRDLSPSNILVNCDCTTKICDFGMARVLSETLMTNYVCTRWYRAPELLVGCSEYSAAVDIWSWGCILAECYRRQPLFKQNTEMQMITEILEVLGHPPEEVLNSYPNNAALWFRQQRAQKPNLAPKDWKETVPHASEQALQLIQAVIRWDPSERMTVEQARAHPFFCDQRTEEEEEHRNGGNQRTFRDSKVFTEEDVTKMTNEQCLEAIFREMLKDHPDHEKMYAEFTSEEREALQSELQKPIMHSVMPPIPHRNGGSEPQLTDDDDDFSEDSDGTCMSPPTGMDEDSVPRYPWDTQTKPDAQPMLPLFPAAPPVPPLPVPPPPVPVAAPPHEFIVDSYHTSDLRPSPGIPCP